MRYDDDERERVAVLVVTERVSCCTGTVVSPYPLHASIDACLFSSAVQTDRRNRLFSIRFVTATIRGCDHLFVNFGWFRSIV
jgi:hypothetical protein